MSYKPIQTTDLTNTCDIFSRGLSLLNFNMKLIFRLQINNAITNFFLKIFDSVKCLKGVLKSIFLSVNLKWKLSPYLSFTVISNNLYSKKSETARVLSFPNSPQRSLVFLRNKQMYY